MRPIPGYSDYSVDRDGNIWQNIAGALVKVAPIIAGGIQVVTLTRANGVQVPFSRIPALVLSAWLSEKAAKLPIWHGCRGRRDNSLTNLRLSRSPRAFSVAKLAEVLDTLRSGHSITATIRLCGVGRRSVLKIRRRFAPRRKTAEVHSGYGRSPSAEDGS
jgi:hypothetical protein